MKLCHIIVCLCMIWGTYASSPVALKRIRLTKKGIYPDLTKEPSNIQQRPVQQQLKVSKDDLPSYFKKTKPDSLDGWVAKPKKRLPPSNASNAALENAAKKGFCGHYLNYGIQCGVRLNQCKVDADCPGITKCCLVSDCGYLCVKPKDKENHVEKRKRTTKDSDRNGFESATTAEGLKLEDITTLP